MPTDPNQTKKPKDPNTQEQTGQTSPSPTPQQPQAPAASPQPARPSNPPIPGTGPNGPTSPQASASPANQVQGSGYVNAQRYMDLLGPTFQQQAAARAQQAGSQAANTQGMIQKATNSALGKQVTAQVGAPNDPSKFTYQGPATLKDSVGDDKVYDQMTADAARYGDEAGIMGSDAGLSAYLQSQGVPSGAMSDFDAAMLGMGTTGFQDNARRYGDLLGQLGKSEKAVGEGYKKNKEESDAAQAKLVKSAADSKKQSKSEDLMERRAHTKASGGGKTKPLQNERKANMRYRGE
jgi:hypothetical protein